MAKKDPGAGPYSRDYAPLRRDTTVDDAGNPDPSGRGKQLPIDDLHTDIGSKPLPPGKGVY